ncbi:MlrC domain protein [Bacillus sp. Soil768D1]|nr:MlrC domain protein [Bacillus sp. Soil768D1]
MRIGIGHIMHETNTFSAVKTTEDSFKEILWARNEEVLRCHDGVKDYIGGMIDKGRELGADLIPSFSAFANPAGTITKECFEILKKELITNIQDKGKLDAICLALHGAGVVDGIDDLEGELLRELRKILGYEIPIVVTLDLHGNLSETMVKEANLLLGVKYYPHIDCYETGLKAMDLTVKILKGEINPVMVMKKLPILIPIAAGTTDMSPAKDITHLCLQMEEQTEVIDCTFFHGFPYTDIPDVSATVITITDGNDEIAQTVCKEVAKDIWAMRAKFLRELPDPKNGMLQALSIGECPIIINESSDNPGAGAPGDGTYLLREMLEFNIPKSCFGFIYDPEVANLAHQVGVGGKIDVSIGGKTDSLHGEPIALTSAYIKALTDGRFTTSSPMMKGFEFNLGKSVRLQVGNVDIIVCSVNWQTLDEQIFLLHGIDVTEFRIVALKSAQHFRAGFKHLAKKIISVDSPGLSTSKVASFNYQRIIRPIYPLDCN